jgi:hypothetical protein
MLPEALVPAIRKALPAAIADEDFRKSRLVCRAMVLLSVW